MKLYEINRELEKIIDVDGMSVDEETGEIIDKEALNALQMQRDEKIENIGCFILNLISDAKQLDEEAKKLKARADGAKKKADWLKGYLTSQVKAGEKMNFTRCRIGWIKSKRVIFTVSPEELPGEFKTTKVTITGNKTAMKKALTEGRGMEYARLEEVNNIQVK